MRFEIKPYQGAGNLLFGMTTQEIKDLLKTEPQKFKKTNIDEYETDAYNGFHIYYRNPGVCEAIEFFTPSEVLFMGVNIMGEQFLKVKDLIEQYDSEIEIEETGFTTYKYGFGVYAPYAEDEPNEPVEGVIIFEKGYYE